MQLHMDRRAALQPCELFSLLFLHHLRFASPFFSRYIYMIYNLHVYIYSYIPSLLILFNSLLAYLLTFLYHSSCPRCCSCLFSVVCTPHQSTPPLWLSSLPSDTFFVLRFCFVRVFLFVFSGRGSWQERYVVEAWLLVVEISNQSEINGSHCIIFIHTSRLFVWLLGRPSNQKGLSIRWYFAQAYLWPLLHGTNSSLCCLIL
jgi:hypothetical protein